MKKQIIVLGALLLVAFSGKAQKSNACKQVQTGDFKLSTENSGTTLIKRTKKHQIERNFTHGYEAKFDVLWLDE